MLIRRNPYPHTGMATPVILGDFGGECRFRRCWAVPDQARECPLTGTAPPPQSVGRRSLATNL